MRYNKFYIVIGIFFILLGGCEQSDPPDPNSFPNQRNGLSVFFSGFKWTVKTDTVLQGPGPNYFSDREEDIYFDDNGYLHMRIAKHDSIWYSTEIVADKHMGYGTYTFTLDGDYANIPENVVVGLFTWDNNTFFEQANSEIDIEFSKWGNASQQSTLQYGIQPINFGNYYGERAFKPSGAIDPIIGVSTHQFTWTDTLVTFRSFTGDEIIEANQFAEWTFGLDNPPRIKLEGLSASQPVVIPEPGTTTNARINFWLLNPAQNGPAGNEDQEIVIRSFNFEPL